MKKLEHQLANHFDLCDLSKGCPACSSGKILSCNPRKLVYADPSCHTLFKLIGQFNLIWNKYDLENSENNLLNSNSYTSNHLLKKGKTRMNSMF